MYTSFYQILETIRFGYRNNLKENSSFLKRLKTDDYLFVDDIMCSLIHLGFYDYEYNKKYAKYENEHLINIFQTRLKERKPTVFVSTDKIQKLPFCRTIKSCIKKNSTFVYKLFGDNFRTLMAYIKLKQCNRILGD